MSTDLDVNPTFLMPVIIDRTVLNNRGGNVVVAHLSSEHSQHKQKEITESVVTTVVMKKRKEVEAVAVADTVEVVDEENPITPTLEENKIPAPRSPPPAPRKRRCSVAVACRKKLDFLEQQPQLIIPKDEEIKEFFASSFDQIHSRRLLKRRCPCV
ncbi:hypothetical protein SOVF_014360 [Spinacia oleracea]|nr:hypothetical protein SOVF_014360 [Spinacia oleracea]